LSLTHYPEWRKEELRIAYKLVQEIGFGNWCKKNKMHVKLENYEEWKWCRLINARVDGAKVTFGPYIKAIETEVYKLPYFIKHIPVLDRPKYIKKMLGLKSHIYSCDYTAFESHMTEEMMRICEMQLYSYMLQYVNDGSRIISLLKSTLAGRNSCLNDLVDVSVDATRMSGDMSTSLGNGFTNLMCIAFLMSEKKSGWNAVVEGDDSLITCDSTLTPLEFESVGLTTKMVDEWECLNEASFCGMVFSGREQNLQNPITVLAKIGWSMSQQKFGGNKVRMSLLRAKGFSLLCESPACPILKSLTKYILRVTKQYEPLFDRFDKWHYEQYLASHLDKCFEELLKPVAPEDRHVVEKIYGVPEGVQIAMENILDGKEDLQPIDSRVVWDLIPSVWKENWDWNVALIRCG